MISKNFCTMYIVRHGQSHGNLKHAFSTPHTDLTDEGMAQAATIAKELANIHFDAVFSSSYLRAKRTAEIIVKERKIAVTAKEALREHSMGIVEGKSQEELTQELKDLFQAFRALPEKDKWSWKEFEGMESGEEAVARFITGIRELAIAHIGKTILIVAHGGVMRGFLLHLGWAKHEEMPAKTIKNTGYFVVESDGVDFFVKKTVGVTKKPVA